MTRARDLAGLLAALALVVEVGLLATGCHRGDALPGPADLAAVADGAAPADLAPPPPDGDCPDPACGLAGHTAIPDGGPCPLCAPVTCESGKLALEAHCGFSKSWLGGLSCDAKAACIVDCMKALTRCEEVGCDFCETCDCAGGSPFGQCVGACLRQG